jgi:hypothetical protein
MDRLGVRDFARFTQLSRKQFGCFCPSNKQDEQNL